jgi:hypothetical protein
MPLKSGIFIIYNNMKRLTREEFIFKIYSQNRGKIPSFSFKRQIKRRILRQK